jgi:hypothetical protein
MVSLRMVRVIESRSDELAAELITKPGTSSRTADLRKIPVEELRQRIEEILRHLSEWLPTKMGHDIEKRYFEIGERRASRGSGGFQNAVETPVAAAEEPAPPAWVKPVEDAVGRKGTFKGSVLSFGVPRSDTITMAGMTIPPAAGVGEAINLQATDSGKVATTGDFVLTADEVDSVISELQGHHILVTALHSHMLTEQPRLFFMHFWSVGSPESVGAGIKVALSRVAVK